MVAVLPPLLSDQPPEVPQRAGLGDRFHYFRGNSGRRYLFSTVAANELADFHSAVVVLAKRVAGGRLAAHWIAPVDPFGHPQGVGRDRRWPLVFRDTVILVHLLAAGEAERRDLVADLSAAPLAIAA